MSQNHATPRWVKVAAIIAIVLAVILVVLHLTGNGFSHHGSIAPYSVIASIIQNGMQHL
jgi:hypothetical protein